MKRQIVFEFQEFESRKELSQIQQELLDKAEAVMKNAYAPYSNFMVGCSILLENGEYFAGNNQENVAYPSGLCAERVALFYASAMYPDTPIRAMAVIAMADFFDFRQPVTPCGACRQVLIEYEQKFNKPIEVILASKGGKVLVINDAKSLLPLAFEAKLKSKNPL